MIDRVKREAKTAMPKGYYELPPDAPLRNSDLVWSWTSQKYLRADSPIWKFPTSEIPRDEIICVIRQARLEDFKPVTTRTYTIREVPKEPVQGELF